MKKIILSFLTVSAAFLGFGQIAVTGVSPANIQGNYNFTISETTSGWGTALDFTVPGTNVQGELVMVEDGTVGTNPQGHPISQEGCSNLTNGSNVLGKIAVVYRNTCEFGTKAKKAQDAGAIAVIILNRDNEVIGIGGGVEGPNVTIPVVMLSNLDGQLITSEMANGPVVMFIGNKAGISSSDLSMDERLILTPLYNGVHSLLAQDANEFFVQLGLRIYNFGSGSQTGAKVNAKITGPGGTAVYDDTITFNLNGVTGNIVDSIDIFPGETVTFPNFSLSTYPEGEYTLEYKLVTESGTDDFPNDNYYTIPFVINNSSISKSRLDPVTLLPIVDSYTGPAEDELAPFTEIRYCVFFRDANASRLAALGFYASSAIDTAKAASLINKSVFAEVFKWNDNFVSYTDPGYGYTNLLSVASSEYIFANAVDTEDVYFEFDAPLYLEDNQKYLFCIINYGEPINFGFDRSVDFNATMQQYGEPINPLFIEPGQQSTNWFRDGFGPDITPSIAIHAISADIVNVENLVNLTGSAYPNPANDMVNITIPLNGKAVVTVNDLTGRTVANHSVDFVSNHTTVNISELQSGMYVFNVVYDNGSKSTFNVVKK